MDLGHAILGLLCGVLLFLLILALRPRRTVERDSPERCERPCPPSDCDEHCPGPVRVGPAGLHRLPNDCSLVVTLAPSQHWPAGRLEITFGLLRNLLKASGRVGMGDWKGSTRSAYHVLVGISASASCSIFGMAATVTSPVPVGQSWSATEGEINLNYCRVRVVRRSSTAYETAPLVAFLEDLDYDSWESVTAANHALRVALGRGPMMGGTEFPRIDFRLEKVV